MSIYLKSIADILQFNKKTKIEGIVQLKKMGGGAGGRLDVNQELKVLYTLKNRGWRSGVCEPRIEGIVQFKQEEDQWSYKRSPDYCPGKTTTMKKQEVLLKIFCQNICSSPAIKKHN